MSMDLVTAGEIARLDVRTPLGGFEVVASSRGLRSVTPLRDDVSRSERLHDSPENGGLGSAEAMRHARAARGALHRYAEGERLRYDGPLDVPSPAIHLAAWERVRAIPFGATATYGEIAAALGMPGEARAVGAAVASNPLCILVPCHRVLAKDGSLRGFAWGLDLKRRLLAHEGSAALSLFAG